jgi:hypothetical protein
MVTGPIGAQNQEWMWWRLPDWLTKTSNVWLRLCPIAHVISH